MTPSVLKARRPGMLNHLRADLAIIRERDPAARGPLEILLCYPGFQALTLHRLSHGVFIDHGMGVVIGETAEVGDRCLLYQGVTLGGTGKDHGKRHPTLANNVVVGAGAKVLGAIEVGANTRIGAGSVVVRNVEADCTVVGIPGRVIHQSGVRINPLAHSALPDTEANVIRNLMERIDQLETKEANLQTCLKSVTANRPINEVKAGKAQNLKDRQILDILGDLTKWMPVIQQTDASLLAHIECDTTDTSKSKLINE